MGLREEARTAQAGAPPSAEPVPGYVTQAGGPEQYAARMTGLLTKAILEQDWNIVRQISQDPWVAGDTQDKAKGALAGAGVDGMNGRTPMPTEVRTGPQPDPDGRVIGTDPEAGAIEIHRVDGGQLMPAKPRVVQGTRLHLTPYQHEILLKPINPNRVKKRDGKSHLEAWDDRRTLIRIFGFGGFEIKNRLQMIFQHIAAPGEIKYRGGGSNERPAYTVVYSCETSLTIFNPDGSVGAYFEDAATGDGTNMPTYQAAADFAIKTAASQALKRCCVNLGDQFGLSLYDGGNTDAVVGVTLVGPVLEGGDQVIEQAMHSDRVRGEEESTTYTAEEDPGSGATGEVGPTGLPVAQELAFEVLDPKTPTVRLSAIYKMIHPTKGTQPALGQDDVYNEDGKEEKLAALVFRIIQDRKKAGS